MQRKVGTRAWRDGSTVRSMSLPAEDLRSAPNTYVSGSQLPVPPASGDPMPLASMGTCSNINIPTQTHTHTRN